MRSCRICPGRSSRASCGPCDPVERSLRRSSRHPRLRGRRHHLGTTAGRGTGARDRSIAGHAGLGECVEAGRGDACRTAAIILTSTPRTRMPSSAAAAAAPSCCVVGTVAASDIVSRTGNHARSIGGKEDHYRCHIFGFDPRYAERCPGRENLLGLFLVCG
jgi:hypothetical protein